MRITDSAFKRVLGEMNPGKKILIQILLHSPHRSFVMHDDSSDPTVFLIGGIGIVPAYSMIKDATEKKLKHKIFLFYSNRRPEDAAYLNELQNLEKQNPNFRLIATMTDIKMSSRKWLGETGFIDQNMLNKYLDDLKSPIYYIAGLTDMVNAMKKLVKDIGVKEESIHSENFSGMKMSLINMTSNTHIFKSHFIFIVIGLMIIFGILAHIGAGFSIHNAFTANSFSYLTIGSIILILILKFLVVLKIKNKMKKIKQTN
jgi:ferredoxin-NADP reductase